MSLASDFLGGGVSVPGFSSKSSSSSSGTQVAPWNQGDVVLATGHASATGGARSYVNPATLQSTPYDLGDTGYWSGTTPATTQQQAGVTLSAGGGKVLLIAAALVVGVIVWSAARK